MGYDSIEHFRNKEVSFAHEIKIYEQRNTIHTVPTA